MWYNQAIIDKINDYIDKLDTKSLQKISKKINKTINKRIDEESDERIEYINNFLIEKLWYSEKKVDDANNEIDEYTKQDYLEALIQTIEKWDHYVKLSIVKELDTPNEALEKLLYDESDKIRELAAARLWAEKPNIIENKKDEDETFFLLKEMENIENELIIDNKKRNKKENNKIIEITSDINNSMKEIYKKMYYHWDNISNDTLLNNFMTLYFDTLSNLTIEEKYKDIFLEKLNNINDNFIENKKISEIFNEVYSNEIDLLSKDIQNLIIHLKS